MILKVYERDGAYHATIARADTMSDIRTAAAQYLRQSRRVAHQRGESRAIFTRVHGAYWVNAYAGQIVRILVDRA